MIPWRQRYGHQVCNGVCWGPGRCANASLWPGVWYGYHVCGAHCGTGITSQNYEFACQAGDVVVLATDGLFDNVFDTEIAGIVGRYV
eukprot:scaffold1729_cov375-Prasinococcus_capsulatus_cf.AAC.3